MKPAQPHWWQRLLLLINILAVCASIGALIVAGYWQNQPWIGFTGKTLWDWMQLLLVPVAIIVGTWVFTTLLGQTAQAITQHRTQADQEIAHGHQREALLRGYLDRM